MIGVLTASTTSGSVLGYDLGDLKNKDQKIRILSSEGVFLDARQVDRLNQNWTDESSRKEFKYISRSVANDLAHQFDSQASMNDRIVRTTGHVSLSFSPADLPKLDDETMVKYAEEYMERMGIVDTQYVITRHFETNAPHLHIAYNRVKYDGTVINSKNERYRSQKVAAEISKKYGLAVAGESPRREESLSPQQTLFSQMRTLAREALQKSCTMEEFKLNLRELGIEIRLSEHSEQQKSYGISYAIGEISAKGSKLDRSALSYAKVTSTLEKNLATRTAMEHKDAQDVARLEKFNENKLWNTYNTHYKPLIDKLQKSIDDTMAMRNYLYEQIGECAQEINERYNHLRQINAQIEQATLDIRKASTSKGILSALAGIITVINPVAGLVLGLVSRIISEGNRRAAFETRKALYVEAKYIRRDIERIKEQQAENREENTEIKEALIKDKAAKAELFSELNTLREQLTKPVVHSENENEIDDKRAALDRTQTTSLIHVTRENHKNIRLPDGYRTCEMDGRILLEMPSHTQEIPKKGIYLIRKSAGIYAWSPYPPRLHQEPPQEKEGTKRTKKRPLWKKN